MAAEISRRIPLWGRLALGWALFIGVGALAGTIMMWFIPDVMGMNDMLIDMQVLPFPHIFFQTLFWPGLFLLIVNGLTQFKTAELILRRDPRAPIATILCGAILMAWITIQFVIFPMNWLSTLYFVFGIIQVLLGWVWLRQARQRLE